MPTGVTKPAWKVVTVPVSVTVSISPWVASTARIASSALLGEKATSTIFPPGLAASVVTAGRVADRDAQHAGGSGRGEQRPAQATELARREHEAGDRLPAAGVLVERGGAASHLDPPDPAQGYRRRRSAHRWRR
jgi:hypothetical protein